MPRSGRSLSPLEVEDSCLRVPLAFVKKGGPTGAGQYPPAGSSVRITATCGLRSENVEETFAAKLEKPPRRGRGGGSSSAAAAAAYAAAADAAGPATPSSLTSVAAAASAATRSGGGGRSSGSGSGSGSGAPPPDARPAVASADRTGRERERDDGPSEEDGRRVRDGGARDFWQDEYDPLEVHAVAKRLFDIMQEDMQEGGDSNEIRARANAFLEDSASVLLTVSNIMGAAITLRCSEDDLQRGMGEFLHYFTLLVARVVVRLKSYVFCSTQMRRSTSRTRWATPRPRRRC